MYKIANLFFVLVCCCVIGVACSIDFDDRSRATSDSSTAAPTSEDFSREYDVRENHPLKIKNVSGDINVRGTDGARIVVRGIKEGRDRDQIFVEDFSNDDQTDIGVRHECRRCEASVRFEIEVPRSMRLRFEEISTASGNVRIENVTGLVAAKTASGNVRVADVAGKVRANSASGNVTVRDIKGMVDARTASGNVEVSIKQLDGDAGDMEYSTASGNVEVSVPDGINADVELSTVSGSVKTDFPLEVRRPQYGPGESAEGKLGSGGRKLKISAASGNVKLMRS